MPVRILLVEDNPGDALIFREKLSSSDLEAELVHVVRLNQGLEALARGRFDILLVDLSLPDAQGIEAVVQVRKAAPAVPVIVLTGLDDATVAAEAKKSGAVDYLVKWYVDSVSLARYIRYAIEQYRLFTTDVAGASAPAPAASASGAGTPVRPPADSPEPVGDAVEVATEDEPAAARPANGAAAPRAARAEAPAAEAPAAAAPAAPAAEPDALADSLSRACEVALDFAERTARQSLRTAHVLRGALDLLRHERGGGEVRLESLDVLDLARQAGARHRDLALERGVPLRVASPRKKVIAVADRNLLTRYFDRLLTDALWTARPEGVAVRVVLEGNTAVVRTAWEVEAGKQPGGEGVDTCDALGLTLAGRLAERAGGAFGCNGTDAGMAEATLTLAAPGGDDDE